MKKVAYSAVIVLACMVSMVSCKKDYHCSCTYNNTVKLEKDLGMQVKKNATDACNAYTNTVTGEDWTCIIY